jgi:uncharacterized protein YaaR (DUF327 family)
LDISREILDTGRLVLNENHRNEITHFDKSIAEFVEIKETGQLQLSTKKMLDLLKGC